MRRLPALVVALALGAGCDVLIDGSRHVRPERPEQVLCADDSACPGDATCHAGFCQPCWHNASNVEGPAEGSHELSVLYLERPDAPLVYVAWTNPDDPRDAGLVRTALRRPGFSPQEEVDLALPAEMEMDEVYAVALGLAPEALAGDPGASLDVPVIAVLGRRAGARVLRASVLPRAAGERLSPTDIPLAAGATPVGPLAIAPSLAPLGTPTSSEAPRAWIVWRELREGTGAAVDAYLPSHGQRLAEPLVGQVDDGGFFLRASGGRALVYGPRSGDVAVVFVAPGSGPLEVSTPGRVGPADIAEIEDGRYALVWPLGEHRLEARGLTCFTEGCLPSDPPVEARIHREHEIGPLVLTSSAVGPLLFLERVVRYERELARIELIPLGPDDLLPRFVPEVGLELEVRTLFAGRVDALAASAPRAPVVSPWGSVVVYESLASGERITAVQQSCGLSPDYFDL